MEKNKEKSVIIVAGGQGKRMDTQVPKQFLILSGWPVLMHTILKFYHFDPKINIILVLPFNHIDTWNRLCSEFRFLIAHKITTGGDERFFSVKNGLDMVSNKGLVAIHDGVRPLVSEKVIRNSFETADQFGGSIPVIPPSESLRLVQNNTSKPVDRNRYFLVQTPQTFKSEQIKKAYSQPFEKRFTDDATVFESNGNTVALIEGNRPNIKITWPSDVYLAQSIFAQDITLRKK